MGNIGNGTISYPTDTMREVAQDILRAVQNARQQHDQHWNVINHYINFTCAPAYKPLGIAPVLSPFHGDLSRHMKDVLEPHANRLTSSYDWLEKFANSLLQAADAIDQTDKAVQGTFQ